VLSDSWNFPIFGAIALDGAGANGFCPSQKHEKQRNQLTIKPTSIGGTEMKFNKWTLGLAAIGVVSLASAARADEKMSPLQTALSNTTVSGYVSASFNWAISPGGSQYVGTPPFSPGSPAAFIPYQGLNKQDGFNLDVVKLSIAKPQDESAWASGYQVDLLFGPDAVGYNTSVNAEGSADFAIKQAYVVLRTPVGNGIDWKVGVFDSIIGYEVFDAGSNPNYTRSWGYWMEPTEHTGILATYKVNDMLSLSAGVANTLQAGINKRDNESGYGNGAGSYWHKTVMGSLTFTAPSSWGWAAGSSFYGGIVYGFNNGPFYGGQSPHNLYSNGYQANYYAGATLNTPWKQLTTGVAFDYVHNLFGGSSSNWADARNVALYGTYKATDKLSLNVRGEYNNGTYYILGGRSFNDELAEVTGTVEYDFWANVVSRLEIRWDHFLSGDGQGKWIGEAVPSVKHGTSVGLYANIIYKF
jgi:hypothetical protein